jgi:hypothetical protein
MKRFWSKVEKTDTCWTWTASLDSYGYGRFSYLGKKYKAHRISWFFSFGNFPTKWLLHKCNNGKCVNPDHLYEGTPRENTRDSIRAGTSKLGEKLTEEQRDEIRNKYNQGIYSQRQLAKEYGVIHGSIQKIIRKAKLPQLVEGHA